MPSLPRRCATPVPTEEAPAPALALELEQRTQMPAVPAPAAQSRFENQNVNPYSEFRFGRLSSSECTRSEPTTPGAESYRFNCTVYSAQPEASDKNLDGRTKEGRSAATDRGTSELQCGRGWRGGGPNALVVAPLPAALAARPWPRPWRCRTPRTAATPPSSLPGPWPSLRPALPASSN